MEDGTVKTAKIDGQNQSCFASILGCDPIFQRPGMCDRKLDCVCSVQCAVCRVQCTVYSVQCTVCSVQFAVCKYLVCVQSKKLWQQCSGILLQVHVVTWKGQDCRPE